MIIVDVAQNSPEWETEKLGKPSASNASKIITNEGKPSKQRDGYMYELASEIITGKKSNGYKNEFMEEGHNREQEARDFYSLLTGNEIKPIGVVYKDDGRKFLCSPDGIINGEEGFECKNPLPKTQVKYLLDNEVPSEYFGQVQFSLYVTGFKFWNFFSYVPSMKPFHLAVKRDESYIATLEKELNKFCEELADIVRRIK